MFIIDSDIGEFIEPENIRHYLKEHGFDKSMKMLQEFQDEIENERIDDYQNIANEEEEFEKWYKEFLENERANGNDVETIGGQFDQIKLEEEKQPDDESQF